MSAAERVAVPRSITRDSSQVVPDSPGGSAIDPARSARMIVTAGVVVACLTSSLPPLGRSVRTGLSVIRRVARLVAAESAAGHQVAVVVSAMAGRTNELVAWTDGAGAAAAGLTPSDEEYDVVVASGEQVTAGLLALTLRNLGCNARSWLAWQVPVITDEAHGKARIDEVPPENLEGSLAAGEIPVVAGFQGIDRKGRLSTLGRGAGDLSAVAVAASLRAVASMGPREV